MPKYFNMSPVVMNWLKNGMITTIRRETTSKKKAAPNNKNSYSMIRAANMARYRRKIKI